MNWQKKMGVALLILGLIVAGCGGEKKSDGKGDGPIKIGANLEMTGGNASFGLSATNGAKLAIKEFNAKGGLNGRPIELVVADNKSEVAESAAAMQKLVSQDKVVAVIAPIASSSVIAAAQVSQDSKILAISPTASNPKVTVDEKGKVRPYLFRASFIDPFQGSVMAKFAQQSLNAKTAAIYIDNSSDYAKGLAKYFEEEFVKNGGTIVIREAYLQKDTDFKATLTKIKNSQPDVIFVPGYYQEVGLIIKQAREIGLNVPFLGGDGWDSVKLPEIAGTNALNDNYFCALYSPDDQDPLVKNFVTAYEKEYGQTPDSFAALSYDAMNMLIAAMVKNGNADPQKLRDELEKTKELPGVSGKITLNETHDAVKGAVVVGFKDGKQVFKEKIAAPK